MTPLKDLPPHLSLLSHSPSYILSLSHSLSLSCSLTLRVSQETVYQLGKQCGRLKLFID